MLSEFKAVKYCYRPVGFILLMKMIFSTHVPPPGYFQSWLLVFQVTWLRLHQWQHPRGLCCLEILFIRPFEASASELQ